MSGLAIRDEGRTRIFTLNRPGIKNAINKELAEALHQGFIEFDAQYIRWAGESPEDYLSWLQRRFHTYRIGNIGGKRLRKVNSFSDLPILHGDAERVHTDLILVGKQTPEGWLAPEWSIVG